MKLIAERVDGVSLSIGIAQTGPQDYADPDELIKCADDAMYETKRRSRLTYAQAA
jgi:diguanylate cyclase